MNLAAVLDHTVERQPDHLALIGPEEGAFCSYRQLRKRIDDTAAQLCRQGVQSGSCVGVDLPSGLDHVVSIYALWKCGACAVAIPGEFSDIEKERLCRDFGLRGVISHGEVGALKLLRAGPSFPVSGSVQFTPLAGTQPHPPEFASVNAASIRFSSGTTGAFKGVVLSHQTIYERIQAVQKVVCLSSSDRVSWLLSMAHHFATSIVSYLSFGATIILCRDFFGATIVRTAARHGATVMYGSPSHYALIAHANIPGPLPSLRLALSTVSSLPKELAERFLVKFNRPLHEAYGIIEVGLPCINVNRPVDKQGSVGPVLSGYELRLEDRGLGDHLKGVMFRGKGLFDAYYQPWRKREDVLTDGWFATGDLGMVDEEGYLFIRGRSKELITVAGLKFFPEEVETILTSHPAVKEACVFSHPHERLGEVTHAHVVIDEAAEFPPTVAELQAHCARIIPFYKIPEHIVFVEALRRTATGKLIRQALSKTKS